MLRTRIVVLVFGSLIMAAVAVAAVQKTDGTPPEGATSKALADLERHYRQFDADASKLREDISRLSKNHDWLSRNLYRSGMILSYHGPLSDAVALEKEGWFVCDGRVITDSLAVSRFKGKMTPNLQNRFLKGSNVSGAMTGQESIVTSTNGNHSHLLPKQWYTRGLREGDNHGIDTLDQMVDKGNPPVQENGAHSHTVSMNPPAYAVIHIMYVREVAALP
jgi:hypothetical protein